jgi:hypothetical protein
MHQDKVFCSAMCEGLEIKENPRNMIMSKEMILDTELRTFTDCVQAFWC